MFMETMRFSSAKSFGTKGSILEKYFCGIKWSQLCREKHEVFLAQNMTFLSNTTFPIVFTLTSAYGNYEVLKCKTFWNERVNIGKILLWDKMALTMSRETWDVFGSKHDFFVEHNFSHSFTLTIAYGNYEVCAFGQKSANTSETCLP